MTVNAQHYYLFCLSCQILEVQSCWCLPLLHVLVHDNNLLAHSMHQEVHSDPMTHFLDVLLQIVISLYLRQKYIFHTPHLPIHTFPHTSITAEKPELRLIHNAAPQSSFWVQHFAQKLFGGWSSATVCYTYIYLNDKLHSCPSRYYLLNILHSN